MCSSSDAMYEPTLYPTRLARRLASALAGDGVYIKENGQAGSNEDRSLYHKFSEAQEQADLYSHRNDTQPNAWVNKNTYILTSLGVIYWHMPNIQFADVDKVDKRCLLCTDSDHLRGFHNQFFLLTPDHAGILLPHDVEHTLKQLNWDQRVRMVAGVGRRMIIWILLLWYGRAGGKDNLPPHKCSLVQFQPKATYQFDPPPHLPPLPLCVHVCVCVWERERNLN